MSKMDQVQEVYDRLPELACKGLCQDSCTGPIPASRPERIAVSRVGKQLPFVESTCVNLVDGACAVYESRPLICRLWGMVENMACPHGCVPEGGHLTRLQGAEVVMAVVSIAGEAG